MPDQVVGLDIGASSVKAAQVRRHRNGTYVVEKQAARPLPRGAVYDGRISEEWRLRVAEEIRALWADAGFNTNDVIFGYNSSAAVFMTEMVLPLIRPEDIDKALPPVLMAKDPNLNPEHTEFSYTVVGEQEGEHGPEMKVLVYSVRVDYAEEIGKVIENAGLNVVGADLNALAALRAIKTYRRPRNVVDGIVDIGANATMLLLHHNGVPKMLHLDPDSAGNVATDRVADEMGLDDIDFEKAEFEKINNSEGYGVVGQARNEYSMSIAGKIAGGFGVYMNASDDYDALGTITLCGGGANLYGLGHFLRRAVGDEVPLLYAEIDDHIVAAGGGEIERHENGSGGDYLVAVGLGTGARL